MNQLPIRERTKKVSKAPYKPTAGVARLENVATRPRQKQARRSAVGAPGTVPITRPQEAETRRLETQRRIARRQEDKRVQHELQQMQQTEDLREVDDDVEALATLFEWQAPEHVHRPKSRAWFATLAAATAIISVGFALTGNIMATVAIALAGGLTYYIAQQPIKNVRYRIMADGLAFNNTLYHYQDLEAFNIIYKPGETKTVLVRSARPFAPLLHMEIGDTDPVAIRDLLLDFVPEDLHLTEPLVDIYARRLGF